MDEKPKNLRYSRAGDVMRTYAATAFRGRILDEESIDRILGLETKKRTICKEEY